MMICIDLFQEFKQKILRLNIIDIYLKTKEGNIPVEADEVQGRTERSVPNSDNASPGLQSSDT